jgi:inorganic pyrophosphatase
MKPEHFRAHPWHGVSPGDACPSVVTAYIEIVPTDTVKFEVDKESGILRIDRPQRYSNVCPFMYGFIPRTLCADAVAGLCMERSGRSGIIGDADPVDICILTEHTVHHGDILVSARPIGGLRIIDKGEADDKIIAVLEGDPLFSHWKGIEDCPSELIDRIAHYFITYKLSPDTMTAQCEIVETYSTQDAHRVIEASISDYQTAYWCVKSDGR